MPIPPTVSERLDSQGIHYQIIEEAEIAPLHQLCRGDQLTQSQVVKLVILKDSIGHLQALIPADSLLDLSRLCEQQGRNLEAIPPQEYEQMARSQGLEHLPDFPLNDSLPLVVEKRLKHAGDLYLEMGNSGHFLKLPQSEFAKLVANGRQADFCVALDEFSPNSDDRRATEHSVNQFTQLRIKRRLEETLEMPPLPETAEQIIQLRIDPDAGVGELAELVEKDPSLAAQVVSWASSPYYAAPGAIRSVHDAVVRVLGFDLVINLALGLALGRTLELPKGGPHGVTPFWDQSVYCAVTMEGLVKAMPSERRPSMGLAYLSGLLSNYGYLVLAHIFPPYFKVICRSIEANTHVDPHLLEQHVLGIDRETLASQLMDCWSMPEEVIHALRWQNYPGYQGDYNLYARLLYLTNQLLRGVGLIQGPVHPINERIFEELGLAQEDALHVINHVVAMKDELRQMAKNLEG
ncbi:aminoacyl-tRNA deacylase and HDOD domain-containing protein [Ketobacter sp.]|uniref:aminoacyl-tRNA deacylase and HDOD domain-containing protein n=1 Tax=Ketobacter sp. TaxID=2083498 RepID=UPI0025C040B6|nr:HDOD domain-containing protein [Ketobacter sp.]